MFSVAPCRVSCVRLCDFPGCSTNESTGSMTIDQSEARKPTSRCVMGAGFWLNIRLTSPASGFQLSPASEGFTPASNSPTKPEHSALSLNTQADILVKLGHGLACGKCCEQREMLWGEYRMADLHY